MSHEVSNGSEAVESLPIDPDLITDEAVADRFDLRRHRRAQRTIVKVIALAGAAGALARYGLSQVIPLGSNGFPWSTLTINLSGSLAVGVVLVLVRERFPNARIARPLVATGFLGAYTTFSTFSVDAELLLRANHPIVAVVYLASSLIGGVAAAAVGVAFARFVVRLEQRLAEQAG